MGSLDLALLAVDLHLLRKSCKSLSILPYLFSLIFQLVYQVEAAS